MTLGLGLFYVGCVLFMNGVGMVQNWQPKAFAIMNFFTGGLLLIINIINIAYTVSTGGNDIPFQAFYGIATNLLFAFTYLFVGLTNLLELDGRPLAWYCLFVAINTIACAFLSYIAGDVRFVVIWLLWGVLWFLYWITGAQFKNIKISNKFVGYFTSLIGVGTCWIPGLMMIAGIW